MRARVRPAQCRRATSLFFQTPESTSLFVRDAIWHGDCLRADDLRAAPQRFLSLVSPRGRFLASASVLFASLEASYSSFFRLSAKDPTSPLAGSSHFVGLD